MKTPMRLFLIFGALALFCLVRAYLSWGLMGILCVICSGTVGYGLSMVRELSEIHDAEDTYKNDDNDQEQL